MYTAIIMIDIIISLKVDIKEAKIISVTLTAQTIQVTLYYNS